MGEVVVWDFEVPEKAMRMSFAVCHQTLQEVSRAREARRAAKTRKRDSAQTQSKTHANNAFSFAQQQLVTAISHEGSTAVAGGGNTVSVWLPDGYSSEKTRTTFAPMPPVIWPFNVNTTNDPLSPTHHKRYVHDLTHEQRAPLQASPVAPAPARSCRRW